ncbi:hypothetical protein BDZ89DRAFT_1084979, partial [Hymenopellis radicata]
IDGNTEAVCDFLRSRSQAGGKADGVVKDHYEKCRIKENGGFGGLFSVIMTFTSLKASAAFFDTLPFFKGPILGTNFTLACPYTVLAHYAELDWAAKYEVETGLVRVSVGMEERDVLLKSDLVHSLDICIQLQHVSIHSFIYRRRRAESSNRLFPVHSSNLMRARARDVPANQLSPQRGVTIT